MKEIFNQYAEYYDLFYRGKDYAAEAAFVEGLIRRHCPGSGAVLELGCGTAGHALELLSFGREILAVDRSAAMLAQARRKVEALPAQRRKLISLVQGDIRRFRADRNFDAVVSLFLVMSYQAEDADLLCAFRTAAAHLKRGGVFLFDYWHGPAVLKDPPQARERSCSADGMLVTRRVTPVQDSARHLVDVHYQFSVTAKEAEPRQLPQEVHRMRYFFTEELDQLLHEAGLCRIAYGDWLSGREPHDSSWNAYCLARRPLED